MLKLDLKLQPKLNISNGLIQSLEILSMNSFELETFLKDESEENVMLDFKSRLEDERYVRSLKSKVGSVTHSENFIEELAFQEIDLTEYLLEQLRECEIDKDIAKIVHYLILNLDESGYLKIKLEEVAKVLSQSIEQVKNAHSMLLKFEPLGIGARNLSECLISQVPKSETKLKELIEFHLEDVAKNKISKIAESLGVTEQEVTLLISSLKKLNPKPGQAYQTQKRVEYVIPDVFVEVDNRDVSIKMDLVNNIHLNESYLNMLSTEIDEETKEFLKNKLNRTMLLMKSVEMRNKTLKEVMEYVVNHQRDFFVYDLPLKPLRQREVADDLGISISTVSRAINGKYLEYKKGAIALKNLFTGATLSNTVSKDYIKKKIRELIMAEDNSKPLSDSKIVAILEEDGIEIKRRTVQKYRDELGIASSQVRRRYEKTT